MAERVEPQWYPCQSCGNPLCFIPQYQRWYCYRCQKYAEERKSYYPELYRKPGQEHKLRFDALPKILFKPKEAFAEIYHNTGISQGIIVGIIIYVISILISYSASTMSGSPYAGLGGRYYLEQSSALPLLGLAMGIPLSIVSLLAMGWLSAKLAKAIGEGRGDVGKTIGFFGYATVVSLVIGIINSALIASRVIKFYPAGEYELYELAPFLLGMAILSLVGIISFIWSLWVNGTATSVANDVSVGIGVVSYFLAVIIIGVIIVGISIGIAAALFVWVFGFM